MTEKTIHVWLGIHHGSDEDWENYFNVENTGQHAGSARTPPRVVRSDNFSAYNAGAAVPVEDVVIEVPYSDQFEDEYNGLTLVGAFGFSA